MWVVVVGESSPHPPPTKPRLRHHRVHPRTPGVTGGTGQGLGPTIQPDI